MPEEIDLKNFADGSKLHVATPAYDLAIGLPPLSQLPPRPELNGYRLKYPGDPAIYLVDQGYRRRIPDPTTYNNLFRDWSGIVEDPLIRDVPEGSEIAVGAVLAWGPPRVEVYFIEPGTKRWIDSPHTMDVYHFATKRVYSVPPVLLVGISNGPTIHA